MSRSPACTVHLRPPEQIRQCSGSSRKLAGRLTARARARGPGGVAVAARLGGQRLQAATSRSYLYAELDGRTL
jgi:hypothetical protein